MRTAKYELGAMRAATAAALGAALLLGAESAHASSVYPGDIAADLSLAKAPSCTICHDTASGGSGTANKPFAKSMKDAGLTGGANASALKAALDSLKASKMDSDGDGTPDIDELIAGTDPNAAPGQSASGPSPAAPDPTYGCTAEIAPRAATGPGAWLPIALLGGAAIVASARRRGTRKRRRLAIPVAGAALLASAACYETSFVSSSVCSSGLEWTGGNSGSPDMNPGHACISCHSEGGGPRFTIAGTIFEQSKEADSCIGLRTTGTVVITGADGKSFAIDSNEAGNFYSREAVKLPYRAMVIVNGKQNVMQAQQTSGDCNSCHSATGTHGAPGRILPP